MPRAVVPFSSGNDRALRGASPADPERVPRNRLKLDPGPQSAALLKAYRPARDPPADNHGVSTSFTVELDVTPVGADLPVK